MEELKIRNQWPFIKTAIIWFILVSLLIAGLAWARVITLPAWLTFERRAFVHSHQYVENKRAAIARYVSQCRGLPSGAQKTELRQRIATERALLPDDAKHNLGNC